MRFFDALILIFCSLLSFIPRISHQYSKYVSIEQFDSIFNFRCLNYIENNGLRNFFDWFDNQTWYPEGKFTGEQANSGLMVFTFLIKKFLEMIHIKIDTKTLCFMLAPFLSMLIPIYMYLFTKLMFSNRKAALFSATFSATNSAFYLNTHAGKYDNEILSIPLLLMCIYHFFKSIQTNSLSQILLCSLFYGFLSFTSGDCIYISYIFPLYIVCSIYFGYFSYNHYSAFSKFFILGLIFSFSNPHLNNSKALFLTNFSFAICIFVFLQVYMLFRYLYHNTAYKTFNSILIFTLFISLLIIFVLFLMSQQLSSHYSLSISLFTGRYLYIVLPFLKAFDFKVILSVSEQNPSVWASFWYCFGPILLLFPLGVKIIQNKMNSHVLFMNLFSISTLYLSAMMNRNLKLFVFPLIPISSIAVDSFLRNSEAKMNKNMCSSMIHF
ncbi:hypothetical protein TRFO_31620 [Tritrichomonas foetus]|uniref:dolichyl-diphosphooligosaccharide--protein glycotransferase n=1 Tax=Tritrichomonas foetus TaxID=1144522 RepID=A0A1J4JW59_9EUKA|nr:hypothetical protein TRFO_31620 [Tritrichomonas foetus]|eukprot:OHT01525.1 hypothetical protein TRFO_31620 [Tritrichomonas foetus]